METLKIPYPVTSLPSGGLINPGVDNYNPKNYFIEFAGLSYYRVMEYEQEKSKTKTQIEKLGVMIDYLVPQDALNFPVTDLFAIILNTVTITGLDLVGDEKRLQESIGKNETYSYQPYILSNVTCPACKKKHDKVSFGLHQITCLKVDNLLIEGKMKWKSHIQFDNGEENMIFKFDIPRIHEFRQAIREFIILPDSDKIEYVMALKMLFLSLALTREEENTNKTFEKSLADLKDLFRIATGGDAMKLERIYNELLVPPVLLSKFCDCEGAPSVLDITFLIADVLRLQYVNSGRIIHTLYEFPEELEPGHNEAPIQIYNGNTSPLHDAIGKVFGREKKKRNKSPKQEIFEAESHY